jgi:hypothetical protein
MFSSCQPEACLPFNDPINSNTDPIALEIQQRLIQDSSLPTPPLSDHEQNISTIKHFLQSQSNNKESAYTELTEWIRWRRGSDLQLLSRDSSQFFFHRERSK